MHSLFSLGSFIPKIPPSELGFVCKPELPPHINILFRARPPLRFLNFPFKGIHRNYTGVFDGGENILDKFEKEPQKKEIKLPKKIVKIIDIIKKLEIEKEMNKERIKNWHPKNNPKPLKHESHGSFRGFTDMMLINKCTERFYSTTTTVDPIGTFS